MSALSEPQRLAVEDGAEALKTINDFNRKGFETWMRVARGVAPLCDWAEGKSRKARQTALKQAGYGTLNAGTVSRLRHMAKLETAIRVWRDGLTEHQRDHWNSPTSVCNRCPAVRKAVLAARDGQPAPVRQKPRQHVEQAIDTLREHLERLPDAAKRKLLKRINGDEEPWPADMAPGFAASRLLDYVFKDWNTVAVRAVADALLRFTTEEAAGPSPNTQPVISRRRARQSE